MKPIGTGIYLHASMLNHSCDPNACIIFDGPSVKLRCIHPNGIAYQDEITISYIELAASTQTRQKQLQERYCFTCTCKKCSIGSPMDVSFDKMLNNDANILEKISILQAQAKASKELPECYAYMQQVDSMQKQAYGPLHEQQLHTVQELLRIAIDMQRFREALQYSTRVLTWYEQCYPKHYPLLGLSYFLHGKLLWANEHVADSAKHAYDYFQRAYKVMAVSHGNHSALVKQLLELLQQAQMAVKW